VPPLFLGQLAQRLAGGWLLPLTPGTPVTVEARSALPHGEILKSAPEPLAIPPALLPVANRANRLCGWSVPARRFDFDPRGQTDRGKLLVLALKARAVAVEPPLARPVLHLSASRLTPFSAPLQRTSPANCLAPRAAVRLVDSAQPVRESDGLSMRVAELPLQAGSPKLRGRLLRWMPSLSTSVDGGELASFDAKWAVSLKALPPRTVLRPDPARTQGKGFGRKRNPFGVHRRSPLGRLWALAPADLRWVAMAVPVVLGLAWYSMSPGRELPVDGTGEVAVDAAPVETASTPAAGRGWPPKAAAGKKSSVTEKPAASAAASSAAASAPASAPAAAPAAPPEPGVFAGFLGPFQEKLAARAAIEIGDDFRSGLSAWEGDRNWSEGWTYDQSGFIQPGNLALLRPTVPLHDYTFEFLAKIERRAISWVYRAKDTRNYHAGKLVQTAVLPIPEISLVRYVVVNGREQSRKVIPVHLPLRGESLYRIRVDVQGNDFTTSVLGKVVDTYSDTAHPEGGVGLFSARGEAAKVRWVEISHQQDTMGRICAFLAGPRPPNARPAANGPAVKEAASQVLKNGRTLNR